jgi:hypothetical protein
MHVYLLFVCFPFWPLPRVRVRALFVSQLGGDGAAAAAYDHSALHSGHVLCFSSQREMQWKWNRWLQFPAAGLHSCGAAAAAGDFVALAAAWHSMHRSAISFLQIAHVVLPSYCHSATAVHFVRLYSASSSLVIRRRCCALFSAKKKKKREKN